MDYIIEHAEELGLRRIVEQALEYPQVQGILLGIHPLWLFAWSHRAGLGPPWYEWPEFEIYRRFRHYPWWEEGFFPPHLLDRIDLTATSTPDLAWRPPDWKSLVAEPERSPVYVTISLEPESNPISTEDFDRSALLVRQEVRPLARLAGDPRAVARPLLGGVSAGPLSSRAGTIGGILRDTSSRSYALTCAHVATMGDKLYQPSPRDAQLGGEIGTVVESFAPTAMAGGTACNPYSGTHLNEIDASLVEIKKGTGSILEVGSGSRGRAYSKEPTLPRTVSGVCWQNLGTSLPDSRSRCVSLSPHSPRETVLL